MPPKKEIDMMTQARIVVLYQDGMTQADIAARIGLGVQFVRRVLTKAERHGLIESVWTSAERKKLLRQ